MIIEKFKEISLHNENPISSIRKDILEYAKKYLKAIASGEAFNDDDFCITNVLSIKDNYIASFCKISKERYEELQTSDSLLIHDNKDQGKIYVTSSDDPQNTLFLEETDDPDYPVEMISIYHVTDREIWTGYEIFKGNGVTSPIKGVE